MILAGGHTNTLQQLISASDPISQAITSNFPTIHEQTKAPHVTPHVTPHIASNVKWSRVLISNVPTGVSSRRGPWTPEECHEALVKDNPSYATLNITKKPSWIRPPDTYKTNSSSSLIFAFEDPDGHIAQNLLNNKYLHTFGTCTTVKAWKDRLTRAYITTEPTHDNADTKPPANTHSNTSYNVQWIIREDEKKDE